MHLNLGSILGSSASEWPERVAIRLVGGRQPADIVEAVLHLLWLAEAQTDEGEAVEVGRDRVGVHTPLLGRHQRLHDRPNLALVEASVIAGIPVRTPESDAEPLWPYHLADG